MPVSLKDQVVLVVGASSGIGRETAALMAREGAKVVASARREERLIELQEELKAEGASIAVFAADASKDDDMQRLAAFARETYGSVDVLVYVTGTNLPDRALSKLTPANWDMMVNVNLNGAFYITHAVLPEMRKKGAGHLIFVSSISALTADVSGAAYQAAKRGMLGLSHAIRMEEKENGIRTCVLCPGLVESELLEKRPVKPTADMLAKAMQPVDVAEVILSVAKAPARAAITELHLYPAAL
jgi:serine 3-dehydrogenase